MAQRLENRGADSIRGKTGVSLSFEALPWEQTRYTLAAMSGVCEEILGTKLPVLVKVLRQAA